MKKILKAGLVLLLLIGLLCGCDSQGNTPSGTDDPSGSAPAGEVEYTVTIVDGGGAPFTSGVIVQLLQGQEQVSMQAVNDQGRVTKVLPAGEYTVVLQFTAADADYYYDTQNLTLTAEAAQLEIRLVPKLTGEPVMVFDPNHKAPEGQEYEGSNAYEVSTGYTYVPLVKGERNYFLFAAKTAGTYRITTSDPGATVGCYGYTAYIQANSIAEVVDNEMLMSIRASMVDTEGMSNPYVIGVDAGDVEGCVLIIERIGDPAYSIEEDEPWIIYKATEELAPYVLPEGDIYEFDLTADSYTLVFNESDGYYHLNTADGPLVLVHLYSASRYLASFADITSNTGVKKYFYDEDGNFIKREDYTRCLKDYCEVSDEVEGLYPLTEDLKYIIQGHGEYVGWWDPESPSYLFVDDNGNPLPGLNPDIAWLFACCYLEQ